jgi:hypothetical protein
VEKSGSGEVDRVTSKGGKAWRADWLGKAARLRSIARAMAAFISSLRSSFMNMSVILFLGSDTFDMIET